MLKPEDYLAIIAYDLKPEMLTDFTTDRGQIKEALGTACNFPGFSGSRISTMRSPTPSSGCRRVDGRKAILLLSSGVDTFSGMTFDKARRKIQEGGVPIYAVGLMQSIRDIAEATGQPCAQALRSMDFAAGRQPDEDLRHRKRRHGLLPALPRH